MTLADNYAKPKYAITSTLDSNEIPEISPTETKHKLQQRQNSRSPEENRIRTENAKYV